MLTHDLFCLFWSMIKAFAKTGVVIAFILGSQTSTAQLITGKWVTIDDETNEPKSVVEIFEKEGQFFGKITKLFRKPGEDPDPVCEECPADDERYKKKVLGMEIIRNMIPDEDEYSGGSILDPKVGRIYRCRLWLEDNNLKVRGYWGPFYRTQTWHRSP